MNTDYGVMILIIACILIAAFALIPKNRIKEAFLFFVTGQILAWPISLVLILTEKRAFPVRPFPKATDGNLILSYVMYPALIAFFHLYYPVKKKILSKTIYTIVFLTALSLLDILIESQTNLLMYREWSTFHFAVLLLIIILIQRIYLNWFFTKLHNHDYNGEE